MTPDRDPTPYRERLWVPPLWWLLLAGFSASLWLAYQHAYGPTVSVPVALGSAAVLGTGLIAYGWRQLAVQPDGFVAGRAKLPAWAIGGVVVLDVDAARAARGRDADPRAYLLLRGYAPRAVRVEVNDPADPVPYWLVSTRRPDDLAAAIVAIRDAARPVRHDHED